MERSRETGFAFLFYGTMGGFERQRTRWEQIFHFEAGTVVAGGSNQDRRSKNPTAEVIGVTWMGRELAKLSRFDDKRFSTICGLRSKLKLTHQWARAAIYIAMVKLVCYSVTQKKTLVCYSY